MHRLRILAPRRYRDRRTENPEMGPRDLRGSMRTSVGEPDWELEDTDKERQEEKKKFKREDEVSLIRAKLQ